MHVCVKCFPPDDDNKCVWEGEEEDTCMCVLSVTGRNTCSRKIHILYEIYYEKGDSAKDFSFFQALEIASTETYHTQFLFYAFFLHLNV
jgi:hypothetical protein